MQLFLGIDGGGTGCRAGLADGSGRLLGQGQAGSANIVSDPVTALRNVLSATEQAMSAAGVVADPADVVAVLGMAGANVPAYADPFRASLPFGRSRLVSDAVTAARGALGEADGIVAALGTGSVYCRQSGGSYCQIGGWGLILGDEASGAWIGRSILSRALRACDGLVEDTLLLQDLRAELGGPPALVAFARTAVPADFARFAPRVLLSPDAAASAIRDEAARWVVAAVESLQHGDALPVVFLGGLGPQFRTLLAGRWPMAEAMGSALDGAVRLALEEA
jgi:glucosamine kinase